ncbi:MAG: transcriptional regulator, TetR family [Firmicutes bacterium]|nr:transcriptional regulator, TetR family [Bacillota bacterium]
MPVKARLGRPSLEQVAEGERHEGIMMVARDLFGRRGYAAVSIGDIAQGVGVTRSALYHHFASKDELFTAVVIDLLHKIAVKVRRRLQGPGTAGEKLRQLALTVLHDKPHYADMEALMRDVRENLSESQRGAVEAAYGEMGDAFEVLMRQGIANGEWRDLGAGLMAHAFQQLLHGVTGRQGSKAGFTSDGSAVVLVVDLFCNGVAVNQEERGTD